MKWIAALLISVLVLSSLCTYAMAQDVVGDVNADESVDAVDVQLVINEALNISTGYPCDLNGDEKVDAADVQLVINAALGIGPPEPSINPEQGVPGSKVTITGEGFDGSDSLENRVFFGDIEMPVIGTGRTALTTSVPIMDAGTVQVRVEVSGTEVLAGLTFEVLPLPELAEPPGTHVTMAQNDIAAVAATVRTLFDPLVESMDPQDAEAYGAVFDMADAQIETITAMLEIATEEEKQLVDQVFVSSGLAAELSDIRIDLDKRKSKLAEIDAMVAAWEDEQAAMMGAKATMPARYRFVLDWTAARLHHAMEFANMALAGLNAASFMAGPGALTSAVGVMDMFAAFLNGVYTLIEMAPMQLAEGTMIGRVGEGNTIATESFGEVVFGGDFEPETTTAHGVLAVFMPVFGAVYELPAILSQVLGTIASQLLSAVQDPESNETILPPLTEEGVPIYTHDFVGDPPTEPNPPTFDGGSVAWLIVEESVIVTEDIEGADEAGPFLLDASQEVYEFHGSFWNGADQPRVESRIESYTIPVRVKKGLRVTITEPAPDTGIEQSNVRVTGEVRKYDGSRVDDGEITVTIDSGGSSLTVPTSGGGDFDVNVPVGTGEETITVTVTDGDTTATARVVIMNYALPLSYCVVTNVVDDSLSLIDPATNEEFAEFTDPTALDGPRDAVFLPDGETLIVLNNANSIAAHLTAVQIPDLQDISVIGSTLPLGNGAAWSIDLAPDSSTLVVPCRDSDAEEYVVHVIDAGSPSSLRVADTVSIATFDDYGPVDSATGTAGDGTSIALVTTGFYQDGGPSNVVIIDITNPYNVQSLGSVEVTSRGGSIACVPGRPMALVVGASDFWELEAGIDIIDFSDPNNVVVRDTLVRPATFAFGVAVTPDGNTALISNAGDPYSPANSMVFMDISNPDEMSEMTGISPMPFAGTGSPRIAVSPDGGSAVVTSHLSDWAIVFDLPEDGTPLVNDPIETGDFPYGAVFRPSD